MDGFVESFLVPAFFVHTTASVWFLAWWFGRMGRDQETFRGFSWGLAGYGLGLVAWTLVVIIKPDDLAPLILVGVVPFLLGNIGFAKAATRESAARGISPLMILTFVLIVATWISRTFLYESEPYISEEGLLYFGLQPVPVALYIATISVSFLPAIWRVVLAFADDRLRLIMGICLNTFFINAVILVSANEHSLLMINGFVLSAAAILAWVHAARNWNLERT